MEQEENRPLYDNDDTGDADNADEETRYPKYKLTVEVPIFLSMFAVAIAGAPISNLVMYRTCVHALNHTVGECNSFLAPETFNHTQELEDEVQKYVSFVFTGKTIMEAIIPAVLSVFIGAWCDIHGRRPTIVWPLFGIFVSSCLAVVYSMVPSLGPWWFVVSVLPYSISGGFIVLVTSSMCYVSDISSNTTRSLRLMCIQISITLASALGAMVSPYMMQAVGNTAYLLLIASTFYALAYSYAVIFILESLRSAVPGTILTVINLGHLRDMLRTNFTWRPDNGRSITLLVVGASFLFILASYGVSGLEYMYTRFKIHWTMKDYTMFSSVSTAIFFTGSILAVGVVQKLFGISDLVYSMVGLMSATLEFLIKGLATRTWHMYFGSAVSLFGTVSGTLLRSFLTKMYLENDIGKVMSLLSTAEAISPVLAPILYNSLYVYTLDVCPGAFYFMSSGINIICFSFLGIILYLQRRPTTGYYSINDD